MNNSQPIRVSGNTGGNLKGGAGGADPSGIKKIITPIQPNSEGNPFSHKIQPVPPKNPIDPKQAVDNLQRAAEKAFGDSEGIPEYTFCGDQVRKAIGHDCGIFYFKPDVEAAELQGFNRGLEAAESSISIYAHEVFGSDANTGTLLIPVDRAREAIQNLSNKKDA